MALINIKEWFGLIFFKKDIHGLVKEPPELKNNIITLLFITFIFSLLSSLISGKFILVGMLFSTIKYTVYYFLQIFLAGLIIYLVLRYIFKKQIPVQKFLSPYLKVNIAAFGVITYIFVLIALLIIVILLITLLIVFLTKNPALLASLVLFGINLMPILAAIIILLLVLAVITLILEVKIIKNVFNIGWFAGLLILIIANLFMGLILYSTIFRISFI